MQLQRIYHQNIFGIILKIQKTERNENEVDVDV